MAITPSRIEYWEQFIPVLLTAWQANGFAFGVDQHLQLRRLLQNISKETEFVEFKTLLAPIFANNAQTQQEFYQLFDTILNAFDQNIQEHEDRVTQLQLARAREGLFGGIKRKGIQVWENWRGLSILWQIGFLSGIVFLFASGVFWLNHVRSASVPGEPGGTEKSEIFLPIRIREGAPPQLICVENMDNSNGGFAKVSPIKAPPGNISMTAFIQGDHLCFTYLGKTLGRGQAEYEICFNNGDCRTLQVICRVDKYQRLMPSPQRITGIFRPFPPPASVSVPKENIIPMASNQLSEDVLQEEMDATPIAFKRAFKTTSPSQKVEGVTATIQIGGGFSYFSPLKGFIILGTALGLIVLGWWIRRRRQQFTLAHQPSRNAPYAWSIRIPTLNEVDLGQVFQRTLTGMLKRKQLESTRLDIHQTILATLKKGGAIDFQYAQLKQSRQYLVLIDISSQNNHQAKIFDLLTKTLQTNEAPIVRFFFNGNPRFCWNNKFPKGISLSQLEHNYQTYHLILCSSGHPLLHDGRSELKAWTKVFETWHRRVLLTPRLCENWDQREAVLAQSFRLIPGTPSGISSLVSTLEAVEHTDYQKLKDQSIPSEIYQPISLPPPSQEDDLRRILEAEYITYRLDKPNDTLLRWIAACAIPPVLFWDWTLYVGQLLSTSENNQLTLENLFQIARLPYFVEGKMPDQVRNTLLDWLENKYPQQLLKFRQHWDQVLQLEENRPPLGSIAWEGHRVELILNELLQDPKWRRRRRLELELEQLIHGRQERDMMVIRYLESKNGFLDAKLSNRFRKLVQEQRDIVWYWKNWTWQLPVFLIIVFATLLVSYNQPVTKFPIGKYITGLAFTPDSQSILIASGLGSLDRYSVNGDWMQGVAEEDHKMVGLSVSPDNNTILSGNSNRELAYWDISGAPVYHSSGDNSAVTDIAFHPLDPYIVLIGYYRNQAQLWDLRNEQLLQTITHENGIGAVAFSQDGQYLFTGTLDGIGRIWDQEGQPLLTLRGHRKRINTAAFSPDGNFFITGSQDRTAILWNKNGEKMHTFYLDAYIMDIAFSPDGKKILIAGGDNEATLWSATNFKKIRTLGGHRNNVSAVTFSPDGQYALSGDRNGLVKLWQLEGKK